MKNLVEPSSLLFEGTLLGKRGPSWNRASDHLGSVLLGQPLLDKTKLELVILITGLLVRLVSMQQPLTVSNVATLD